MSGAGNKLISNDKLDLASSILRALAHPLRLKLLMYIHENKQVNVNKIYSALGLEQSITSQHLRILRDNNLVLTTREGKFIHYSLNYVKLGHIATALNSFVDQ